MYVDRGAHDPLQQENISVNVIPGRPAHPVEPRTLKHIVNAINYEFISQHPYLFMIRYQTYIILMLFLTY
jgi:hypothetical protein